MTMPFAALARARARMGDGARRGEQERYGRDQDEQQRLFREWATRQQIEAQEGERAYQRGRDATMDARYTSEWDASMGRQREADQFSAVQAGGQSQIPEVATSQILAGMNALQGGGGQRAFDVRAQPTTPFRETVAGAEIKAPNVGGPEYVSRGGRMFKFDKQKEANVAAQGEAQDVAVRDAQEKRADSRLEARDARTMARQLAAIQATQAGRDPNAGLRSVPMGAMQAYQGNRAQLNVIDDALAQIEQNPDAVGWKGKLPGDLLNRLPAKGYSDGVDARAAIADLGSAVIHDRSGAAVTISEFPRLRPFIPLPDDPSDVVTKKLRRMRQILERETQFMSDAYSPDAGYRPLPSAPAAPSARAPQPQGGDRGAAMDAKLLQYMAKVQGR